MNLLRLRHIENDINNKVIKFEDWDLQGPKSMEHLIRKLELDK